MIIYIVNSKIKKISRDFLCGNFLDLPSNVCPYPGQSEFSFIMSTINRHTKWDLFHKKPVFTSHAISAHRNQWSAHRLSRKFMNQFWISVYNMWSSIQVHSIRELKFITSSQLVVFVHFRIDCDQFRWLLDEKEHKGRRYGPFTQIYSHFWVHFRFKKYLFWPLKTIPSRTN